MTSWFSSLFSKGPEKMLKDAEVLAEQERWPEALATLEKALDRAPKDSAWPAEEIRSRIQRYSVSYRDMLIDAIPRFLEEGNRAKAAELADTALTFADSEAERKKIQSLLRDPIPKRKEEAFPAAPEESREKYPKELIDSLLHGYLEAEEPAEQEEILRRPLVFQRAFVLWHQGEAEDAMRAAEEHLEKQPNDPYGLLYLGLSRGALGKVDEAAEAMELALRIDPSLLSGTLGLAAMERQRGNWRRAITLLEKASKEVRDDPERFGERRRDETLLLTLQVLLEAGKTERAESFYRELRREKILPVMPPLEARLAEARGALDEAERAWDSFLRETPGTGTITGHGSRATATGPAELEEAGDFFERRAKLKKAAGLYQRAALLFTQRVHYGGEALPMENLFRLKKKMAFLLIEMGKYEEAEDLAAEMEQEEPPPPEAAEIRRRLEEGWPESE